MLIDFKIVTPDGVVYESEVEKITVPTTTGEITILPNHIPLVSVLQAGELLAYKEGNPVAMSVSSGIVEVRPDNKVYIMADTAERAEHIDIERAEVARKRAEEMIQQKENEADVDFARLQAVIEREMARVKVAKKWRKLNK